MCKGICFNHRFLFCWCHLLDTLSCVKVPIRLAPGIMLGLLVLGLNTHLRCLGKNPWSWAMHAAYSSAYLASTGGEGSIETQKRRRGRFTFSCWRVRLPRSLLPWHSPGTSTSIPAEIIMVFGVWLHVMCPVVPTVWGQRCGSHSTHSCVLE